MNRKTFLGSILGFGFIANLNAAVKEKVRRIIKDYAGDTLQVRRLEIVDEKGEVCGFIEEREGKMVIGMPKKPEPEKAVGQNGNGFIYQEPSVRIKSNSSAHLILEH